MAWPADGAAARDFHRSMAVYAPTPLVDCARLAQACGVKSVVAKDESARFGLNSFKILGASWAMARIAEYTWPVPRFAAATAGNHGRAVAWMARELRAGATIFVPSDTMLRRVQNIHKEGAEVRIVQGNYDDAVRECAAESQNYGWQVISDTGYAGYMEIPKWIADGYGTLFAEYEEQRASMALVPPDVVFVQAGVGSLLSAAVRHFRPGGDRPLLVAVEPEEACCLLESIRSPGGQPAKGTSGQNSIMAGLNCGEVSLAAWPAIRCGVDMFLTIPDQYALEAVRRFLDSGIAAGESGAAGLGGLLALSTDPAFREAKSRLGLTANSRVMLINSEAPLEVRKLGRP